MTGKQVNKASTALLEAILECLDRSAKVDRDDRIAVLGLLTGKLREYVDKSREQAMYVDELDDEAKLDE